MRGESWRVLRNTARSRRTCWSARMARLLRRAADCFPRSNHVTQAMWPGAARSMRIAPPPELVRFFDQSFTVCEARSGGHILCYFIPGADAATEPGQRQLNWVWYVPVPARPGLKRLLTDKTGKTHGASVPAGMVPPTDDGVVRSCRTRVAPALRRVGSGEPRTVYPDHPGCEVPRMVFGSACLLGDAAFVLRPHAAVGTAKAATDATAWQQPSPPIRSRSRRALQGLGDATAQAWARLVK